MGRVIHALGPLLWLGCAAMASAQGPAYANRPASTYDAAPAAYEQRIAGPGTAEGPPQSFANDSENAANPSPLSLRPQEGDRKDKTSRGGLGGALTVAGSLAAVLGLFFVVVWLIRRASPGRNAVLPADVFEVLGRAPLAHQQQACLLRCGNKLLLVAVSVNGARTLAEIADPGETQRLTALCEAARGGNAGASFRQVFRHMEKRHA